MNVIFTDTGFGLDDWEFGFNAADKHSALADTEPNGVALDVPNNFDVEQMLPVLPRIDMIRIDFPAFSDGRGFSQARRLRMLGYHGRLRAVGHVLADQYAMARRSGFDEVEIDAELAARQPEQQWLARADWQQNDYQQRLRQFD